MDGRILARWNSRPRLGVSVIKMMTEEGWKPDPTAPIWWPDPGSNDGPFFHDLNLQHIKQQGPSCVPTTLAMIAKATGALVSPEDIMLEINSQAPHTWSDALSPYGMQLAYCNTDVRRLSHIVDELVTLDDLFLVSFYSEDPPFDPPLGSGKLCTAHIVTLHRDIIFDTAKTKIRGKVPAITYPRINNPIKRVFRVLPLGHRRCL